MQVVKPCLLTRALRVEPCLRLGVAHRPSAFEQRKRGGAVAVSRRMSAALYAAMALPCAAACSKPSEKGDGGN